MLVLTRRIGEVIVLTNKDGTKVRIVVLSSSRHQVSIGIEAPREVEILREELCEPSMMKDRK